MQAAPPSPLVIRLHGARFRKRVAAFDYDWTLVRPKSGGTFPRGANDWQWLAPAIPEVLREWYRRGYMIAVITNQSRAFKIAQIRAVLEPLGIPMWIAIATDKAHYKPARSLWDALAGTRQPDLRASFFVGDALGRPGDWADSDRRFAEAVGIAWRPPEDVFGNAVPRQPVAAPRQPAAAAPRQPATIELPSTPHAVIMIGYPGSGKSTLAARMAQGKPYRILAGDDLKTPARMLKAADAAAAEGLGVIFDATNPTREGRARYIAWAQAHRMPVLCVHVDRSLEAAFAQNQGRPADARVPRIAYYTYRKRFEPPSSEEGCRVIMA